MVVKEVKANQSLSQTETSQQAIQDMTELQKQFEETAKQQEEIKAQKENSAHLMQVLKT